MKQAFTAWFALAIFAALTSCGQSVTPQPNTMNTEALPITQVIVPEGKEIATFGAGCFWCVEAIFQSLKGVEKVVSGYSGGAVKNPSYKEVCTGRTAHAEVVQITFDPSVISFAELLEVFFETHDPTTLNRQGADEGTQYRSAVFYHSDEQRRLAELAKKAGDESGNWSDPIVTEITAFTNFYSAEDYHQDYFAMNGEQPYCKMVVRPKVDKFKKKFQEKLK
ncbi:MAG: peptide-methionine (S)-S-oxide reductase MsrA [Flavobacteriales bacterium]|jgi:peptide-methionine (S)-S-oxide reductase